MKSSDIIEKYLDDSIKCLQEIKLVQNKIEKITKAIIQAKNNGRNIFLCGNGGSASTASHMFCDLNKTATMPNKKRLRAISLVDNLAMISAIGNDLSYSEIFVEQLKNYIRPKDVLVAISGSGNSLNVIKAVKFAKKNDVMVIGFTGFNGGKLKSLCDECIIIPSDSMYRIEDMHLMLNHILVSVLREGKDYK